MAKKSFASDNHAGIHPSVLEAMAAANDGDAPAYGGDELTREMESCFRQHFGEHAEAFAVFNGTGANVLGLSLLLRSYEAVICPATAHIETDECGAAERLLGTKLLTVSTPDGKVTPELIEPLLAGAGDQHHVQPKAVSISQASELGTCYSQQELRELADYVHARGLYLHIDGARIANAAVSLGASLHDATVGADVISFGGTKNGLMGAEAVVVMRPELAEGFLFHRKQAMQLASKMRFLAAQFVCLLRDRRWRSNAEHANGMAQRLAAGLRTIDGVDIRYPVDANVVFASLAPEAAAKLQVLYAFHVWQEAAAGQDNRSTVRWMTAFDTRPEDVDGFLADIRRVCESTEV